MADTIERASMDGTSRTVLHNSGLSEVYGIALDIENQVLYWADYGYHQIESSFINGSNRRVLASSSDGVTRPFALTFYDGRLYWTDWQTHTIRTLPVDSPSNVTQLLNVGEDAYGIHIIAEEKQPIGKCKNIAHSYTCPWVKHLL